MQRICFYHFFTQKMDLFQHLLKASTISVQAQTSRLGELLRAFSKGKPEETDPPHGAVKQRIPWESWLQRDGVLGSFMSLFKG